MLKIRRQVFERVVWLEKKVLAAYTHCPFGGSCNQSRTHVVDVKGVKIFFGKLS